MKWKIANKDIEVFYLQGFSEDENKILIIETLCLVAVPCFLQVSFC